MAKAVSASAGQLTKGKLERFKTPKIDPSKFPWWRYIAQIIIVAIIGYVLVMKRLFIVTPMTIMVFLTAIVLSNVALVCWQSSLIKDGVFNFERPLVILAELVVMGPNLTVSFLYQETPALNEGIKSFFMAVFFQTVTMICYFVFYKISNRGTTA